MTVALVKNSNAYITQPPVIDDATPKKTWSKHIDDWTDKTLGAFRLLQLLERVCKAASLAFKEMGYGAVAKLDQFSEKLAAGTAVLVIPRLKQVTQDAWSACKDLLTGNFEGDPQIKGYKIAKKVHDIADAGASWGWAATLVSENSVYKKAAECLDLVGNATDLSMAAQDYCEAGRLLNTMPAGDLYAPLGETRKEAFLRIVKAVIPLATAALGLLAVVLAPWASVTVKLAGSAVAISLYFYKEMMDHKPIKFFEGPVRTA